MLSLLTLAVLSSIREREVIDLNGGWEYSRIPKPPSIWSGTDAVPTSIWRVLSVSSEETSSESACARKAFDGDPNTFWHSEWSKHQAPYPHELSVDLGAEATISGFRLLPRQTGPQNGRPNHVELFLSEDASRWNSPVASVNLPDSSALFERRFAPVKARFMRLVVLDGQRPSEPFLALSEIGLIRDLGKKEKKDWATQYDIANIDTRGAGETGEEELERIRRGELARIKVWQPATLPHAPWIRPLGKPEIWQGVTYYRRRLLVGRNDLNRRLELSLDGAMQSTDLWLNGRHVASRRGGYLPLIVDLTGKLKAQNDLLVRVDSSDDPLIPPGKPQSQLDFMYGSGLTRSVSLTATGKLFITSPLAEDVRFGGGIYVTFPVVEKGKALVRVRTSVRNASATLRSFALRQSLIEPNGRVVAQSRSTVSLASCQASRWKQDLQVTSPRLWSPDAPILYRLRTELVESGKVIDEVTTPIGIRKVKVSRQDGFVLNGKAIRLVGTNRHQDYPWVGPALSDAANCRDALLIKRSGHHIVRLSHYPQSPAFLDACDRMGLFVIPCIPGWQFINRDPRFGERVRRDIRELIRRDRNHPSVAFWEASLNETYPGQAIAREWNDTAKSEELDGSVLTAGDGTAGAPWDVIYNGWKEDLSRPQDVFPDRPGYIREYGDYEFGGAYSSSRVKMGQGMEKLLQETWNHVWSYNRFRTQYPWTMGAGTWEMFDHNVPWEFAVSASGLADIFRREKPSFWFYRSQEERKPFLRIATTWQPGKKVRDVVVFTNSTKASLYINDRLIMSADAKGGKSSEYAKAVQFDGSNTENLAHPPIVFRNVAFEAGELKVVGGNHSSDTVVTAGKPVGLKVWKDDLGVPATGNDLVFYRAAIVDARGNVCPDESRTIQFTVDGATFAGQSEAPAEMGVASVLVRTPMKLGMVHVTAHAPGMKTGKSE